MTKTPNHDYDFGHSGRARKIGGVVRKSELELFFGSQLEFLEIVQDVSESLGRLVGFDESVVMRVQPVTGSGDETEVER